LTKFLKEYKINIKNLQGAIINEIGFILFNR
jgi:hypothetical protein